MKRMFATILCGALAFNAPAYWPTIGLKCINGVNQSTFLFDVGAAYHFWWDMKWLFGQDFCIMTEAALARASYEQGSLKKVTVTPALSAEQFNQIPFNACYAVTNTKTWLSSVRSSPCYALDNWSGNQADLIGYTGSRITYWGGVSTTPIENLYVSPGSPVSEQLGKLTELRTAMKKLNYKFLQSTGIDFRGDPRITSITNGVGSAVKYQDFECHANYVPIWGHYIAHEYSLSYDPPWTLTRLAEGRLDRIHNTWYLFQNLPNIGGEKKRRYNLFYIMKRKVTGVPGQGTCTTTDSAKYVFMQVDEARTQATIPTILETAGMADDIAFVQKDERATGIPRSYSQWIVVLDVTGVGVLDITQSSSSYIRLSDRL